MTLIHDVLQDLTDAVDGIHHVLVPDWLDELERPDWEALDALQHISKTIHATVIQVCDQYRHIIHDSRYGGNGAPPGVATPPDPGG